MKLFEQSSPSLAPRREFFRTGLRYAGISILALLAVRMAAKPRCGRPADPCEGCSLLSGCGLPKARRAKAQPQPNHA